MQPRPTQRPPRAGEAAPPRIHGNAPFAPPTRAKSGHALESPLSKLGSILLLLAISSVAAVGVLMPDEDDPLTSATKAGNNALSKIYPGDSAKRLLPQIANESRTAPQQAYALAYELAKQRVKTVGGLTPEQRGETVQETLAQVLGHNISDLDPAAAAGLAERAPEIVKKAALQGVRNGEAKGISAQSQLLIERVLKRESRFGQGQTEH